MTLVTGTTDNSIEIPQQANGTLVRYYSMQKTMTKRKLLAFKADQSGDTKLCFYTVRDNGLIIPDIQFTYNSNGASPLAALSNCKYCNGFD